MILALSPHLDDAAFSAGGTLAVRAEEDEVVLVTAFTASVPDPEGFALACQTDKGIAPEVDYMALRRAEDERAGVRLGVAKVVHLPLPEAPHRGYGSAAELFAAPRERDLVHQHLATAIARLIERFAPAEILGPQGLGGHVDHVQLGRALTLARPEVPVRRWRDTPYVIRHAVAPGADERTEPITRTLGTKLDACAAYTSQLGFQFGGEHEMRAALTALAEREGDGTPGERFATSSPPPGAGSEHAS